MNKAVLLTVIGLGLSLPSFSQTATYSGGSGTAEDPYQIATAQDLITLGETIADYDKHFILTADIDLSGYTFDRAVIAADTDDDGGGFQGTEFAGNFDGNGYVICNLNIRGASCLGLFGRVKPGGSISRLGLEAVDVQGTGSYVGGLVGESYDGAITFCYSTGTVTGQGDRVGGLVGYSEECTITFCYSTGTVTGGIYYVGGLVGEGYYGTITASYSTGTVTGQSDRVGGLVGKYWYGDITSCYFLQTAGPVNGFGTPLTDSQMKQQGSFVGWDFTDETINGMEDIWRMCVDGVAYPRLRWEFTRIGDLACPDGVHTEDLYYYVGYWLTNNCSVDNNYCGGADLNNSGIVDLADWAIFAGNWVSQ
ncbi:MAG: hypothetical protein JW828_00575 [Sedimentisphaerales bacterium]|nr:hypothetical protein [Sedimentisphaerales bacterium]